MNRRSPEEIKEGVYRGIAGKGHWPEGNVRILRAHPGNGLPSFPLAWVTSDYVSPRDQVEVRSSTRRGTIGISLPGKFVTLAYGEVQKGRTLSLRPGDSAPDNASVAQQFTNVGILPNGREGGLMVVIGQRKRVYNSALGEDEEKVPCEIRPLVFPEGWEGVDLKEIIREGRLTMASPAVSAGEIARRLEEDPQLAFSTISNLVKRLPQGVRSMRDGYFAGHNNNPAKVEVGDESIAVRFVHTDVPAILKMMKQYRLRMNSFLQEGVLSSSSLGAAAPDCLDLIIRSVDGQLYRNVSISRVMSDPQKPNKLMAIDPSCPVYLEQLAELKIGPNHFAEILQEKLCTPEGLGQLFASLSPEKEVVEEKGDRKDSASKSHKKSSGKGKSAGGSEGGTQWHGGGKKGHKGEGKRSVLTTQPGGRRLERKKVEGKRKWIPRNSTGQHAVSH